MKSRVTLKENMHFVGELEGFEVPIEASAKHGGTGKGPQPKAYTLTSLAGCTALDVISLLRKMRAEPAAFWVEAEAELSDEIPKVFTKITITYGFKGGAVTREKAEKAIQLSQEKYCGVSAMLRQIAPIDWRIVID